MVQDGGRRRTPGGVFLYLLRNHDDIPMEKIREVFAEETKNREKVKRTVRAKRRQAQADSLKRSVASKYSFFLPTAFWNTLLTDFSLVSDDLPPLPTRGEVMMMRQQQEQNPFDDEGVVDINFECE